MGSRTGPKRSVSGHRAQFTMMRLRARRKLADAVAPDRARTGKSALNTRLRLGFQIAACDLAEIGGVAHLQNHVTGIGIGAKRDVDAGRPIRLPAVEETGAPRDVYRTM